MEQGKSGQNESKSLSIFIEGAKILLPFGIAVVSVVWVAADAQTERALIQQQLNANDRADVAREQRLSVVEKAFNQHAVILGQIDVKLSNIEKDNKEMLDLLRDIRRVN